MTSAFAPSSTAFFGAFALCALLAVIPAAAVGQGSDRISGSGARKTETRNVSGYRNIALGVPATLELRQGADEGLTITGDDNIVALVETVVENGTLKIRWPDRRYPSTRYQDLVIVVNAKTVESLSIGGTGQVHAAALHTPKLHVSVGGSGAVAIDKLDTDALSATLAGSTSMTVAGRADSLDVTAAGSGQLSAARLETRRARVTLQGSAQATVWATETLAATIAGSGLVQYVGTPQVSQTVAGSGSVRPLRGAT